jgi:hypothetical protein
VTVVVSLSSYGRDFEGGLFVSTGDVGGGGEEYFLGLSEGDAVSELRELLYVTIIDSSHQ